MSSPVCNVGLDSLLNRANAFVAKSHHPEVHDTPGTTGVLWIARTPRHREAVLDALGELDTNVPVYEAGSLEAARELLATRPIALALTAYALPDGFAVEILPILEEYAIPAVFVLQAGHEEAAIPAVRAGAADCVVEDDQGAFAAMLPVVLGRVLERRKVALERDQLLVQLHDALETIQTLRGLIPICYVCKNVRDDAGYWQTVEQYIAEHSLARFSHGLCPHCASAERERLLRLTGEAS